MQWIATIYLLPSTIMGVLFEAGLMRSHGNARQLYHPLGRVVLSTGIWFVLFMALFVWSK